VESGVLMLKIERKFLRQKLYLKLLAPNKTKEKVLQPLKIARDISLERTSKPIGMSTQLIVGATPESE